MRCENCGAEYRMKDVSCPFCQSENPVLAEIRKEDVLKKYDREAQRMRNTVPDKTMKKWTGLLITVCVALAGLALLTGIILAIWAPIKARMDYRMHQRHEQKLEEMLAKQDIEGIYRYIYDKHIYSYDFPKFREIQYMYGSYSSYQYNREILEDYKEDTFRDAYDESRMREETEAICSKLIQYGSETMQLCRQYSRDGMIYGDEALFEEYYEEICRELREMGISDTQLEWMSTKQQNMVEDTLFRQIVDLAVEAYMGCYYPEAE